MSSIFTDIANHLIEGLNILLDFYGEISIAAEHDVIYAGSISSSSETKSLTSELKKKMKELNWHYSEVEGWTFYP